MGCPYWQFAKTWMGAGPDSSARMLGNAREENEKTPSQLTHIGIEENFSRARDFRDCLRLAADPLALPLSIHIIDIDEYFRALASHIH